MARGFSAGVTSQYHFIINFAIFLFRLELICFSLKRTSEFKTVNVLNEF